MFNQLRFTIAQIRENYYAIEHENELLRNELKKLREENAELKRNIEEITSSTTESNT